MVARETAAAWFWRAAETSGSTQATRSQFAAPAPGSIGNTGRNFFLAPNYFQWDASLSKKFKITERVSFRSAAGCAQRFEQPVV